MEKIREPETDPNTQKLLAYCEGIMSYQRGRDGLFNKWYRGN